jgi:UDP-2,3-diacylglucosamine hydrolase
MIQQFALGIASGRRPEIFLSSRPEILSNQWPMRWRTAVDKPAPPKANIDETPAQPLGLIAGNRSLPLLFAREAKRLGINPLVAVAFEGETDPELAGLADDLVWLKVGQLVKLIDNFRQRNVTRCVMLGQIAPRNLFDLRPDWRALKLLLSLKEKNAHSIFGAIADELKKEGIELIEPLPWLQAHMPPRGFLLGKKPAPSVQSDIQLGFRLAKQMARLEIGQTVVVKEGAVLAVEAFEGTDACLERGGALAGKQGGAVAVKVARQNHDMRFDIPCVGARTLEVCARSGIQHLAFEAGKTLLLERGEVEKTVQKSRLTLSSIADESPAV